MIHADPPPPENVAREIAKAVAIAALSALAAKLIDWGVEELRDCVRPKPKDEVKS